MDDITKETINDFTDAIIVEFQKDKHLRHVQFEKWSLDNFKITLRFVYHDKQVELFADLREIKENKPNYLHVIKNVADQLVDKLDLKNGVMK